MMKKQQKGFTLIELMIVVAIIGILASVAIPMYGDYVTRTRLSTVLASVGNIKTAVAVTTNSGNSVTALAANATAAQWQSSLGMRGRPANIDGVSSITVSGTGVITLNLDSSVDAGTLVLTPNLNGATATWTSSFTPTDSASKKAALITDYLRKYAGGS